MMKDQQDIVKEACNFMNFTAGIMLEATRIYLKAINEPFDEEKVFDEAVGAIRWMHEIEPTEK